MGNQNNLFCDNQKGSIKSFSLNDLPMNSTLTANVQQICIVTTYDKIKLALIEYEKAKKLATNWYSYLAMFVSFLIPALTAEFHNIWIIDASFLRALFWLATIIFGVITIVSIILRIKNKKKITIDYCLQTIKNDVDS